MRQRLESWADYFGGIGLALLVVAVIFYFLKRPFEQVSVIGVLGIVFIALFVYARPQQVRQVMTSRGATYGGSSIIGTVLFIAIIAALNWVSLNRYSQRVDLTANKSQSLSDMTIKVLQDLKQPVRATAVFVTQRPDPQTLQDAQDRLKQYKYYSDLFTFRFVDPQVDPQIATDYNVFDGTIVFERGTRKENALNSDEQTLTNALLKVTLDKQQVVYFTTGHGEHGMDDSSDNGYVGIKSELAALNFKFDTINLRTISATLPSDITALVIAGPKQKFEAGEAQLVKDYLDKNGRVLLMVDPQTDTGLDSMLKSWGVVLRNDVIIDPSLSIQGRPQFLVVQSYKSHPTTQALTGFTTIFPTTRSLTTDTSGASGKSATALVSSSPNSWGETNLDSLKNQSQAYDANADTKGPLDFAYAVEASGEKPARLLVIGNSTFVTNGILRSIQGAVANDRFIVDSLNWLAGQENLIAIPPKSATPRNILIPAEDQLGVFVSSICLLPGAILLIGAIIWWRRR